MNKKCLLRKLNEMKYLLKEKRYTQTNRILTGMIYDLKNSLELDSSVKE